MYLKKYFIMKVDPYWQPWLTAFEKNRREIGGICRLKHITQHLT